MLLHRLFKVRETGRFVFAACGFALVALPTMNANAVEIHGDATLTTDYVWRGTSQTQEKPAVQAGIEVSVESGFYASIWGSNVKFDPELNANSEFDFVVGWGTNLSDDWAIDFNVLRYQYPGTSVSLNWTEFNTSVTFKDNYWLGLGYSNKAIGGDASGTYLSAGATIPLHEVFRIEAGAAHYFLNEGVMGENGYTHGWVSAIWTVKAPLELRVTAHATDSKAKTIFGKDNAGTRVEAALQVSF